MRTCVALLVASLLPVGGLSGAPVLPEALKFLAPLILIKVTQDTYRLKEYMCGEDFAAIRADNGDRAAVDAIYARALDLSWGNTGEALLLSMVATMDHRRVEITLPVVGLVIPIPLTGEFEDEFSERVKALPTLLYDDSPRSVGGDRDKLQHFFGSAFLVVATESEGGADELGQFVERGESRYVEGETVDQRDIRANQQGQRFGRAVLSGNEAKPSEFLRSLEAEP
jgi:hypothetical protein